MTEARPGRGADGRRLGGALLASCLGHALVAAVVYTAADARRHAARQAVPPRDEIVTVSTALRFEKRARPVPVARPAESNRGRAPAAAAPGERSDDPLATSARPPPAASTRYRLQIKSKPSDLRRGEGHYVPIKAWHAGGLNYYFVSYAFAYANGSFERGTVPWPVHFAPRDDPFVQPQPARLRRTPLPGPPPGFLPPGTLGRALRGYFPALRFDDG
ncbi:MAG: hypothetical protein NVS3B16_23890 [Vulcanimicrobiaceae bacterium]